MMKKIAFVLALMMVFVFTACTSKTVMVDVDYGDSRLYSKEDMDTAAKIILEEFAQMKGAELQSLNYTSDECNSQENIDWMNDLANREVQYTQCIEFASKFRSPEEGGGSWIPDSEYNWHWWLARADGGEWELMTFGY